MTALPLWVMQAHSADQAVPYIGDLLELVRLGTAPPSDARFVPLF